MSSSESKQINPLQASADPYCSPDMKDGDYVRTVDPNQQNFSDLEGLIAQVTDIHQLVRLPPFQITNGTLLIAPIGAYEGGGRNWEIRPWPNESGQRFGRVDIDGSLFYSAQATRQQIVVSYFKEAVKRSLEIGRVAHLTGNCRDN